MSTANASTPSASATVSEVIADASVRDVERVAIGGGAHGVNLHLATNELLRATAAEVVDVTADGR